jgi:hypothetical protein
MGASCENYEQFTLKGLKFYKNTEGMFGKDAVSYVCINNLFGVTQCFAKYFQR